MIGKVTFGHHSLYEPEMILVIALVSEPRRGYDIRGIIQGSVCVAKNAFVLVNVKVSPGQVSELCLEQLPRLDLVEGAE